MIDELYKCLQKPQVHALSPALRIAVVGVFKLFSDAGSNIITLTTQEIRCAPGVHLSLEQWMKLRCALVTAGVIWFNDGGIVLRPDYCPVSGLKTLEQISHAEEDITEEAAIPIEIEVPKK